MENELIRNIRNLDCLTNTQIQILRDMNMTSMLEVMQAFTQTTKFYRELFDNLMSDDDSGPMSERKKLVMRSLEESYNIVVRYYAEIFDKVLRGES